MGKGNRQKTRADCLDSVLASRAAAGAVKIPYFAPKLMVGARCRCRLRPRRRAQVLIAPARLSFFLFSWAFFFPLCWVDKKDTRKRAGACAHPVGTRTKRRENKKREATAHMLPCPRDCDSLFSPSSFFLYSFSQKTSGRVRQKNGPKAGLGVCVVSQRLHLGQDEEMPIDNRMYAKTTSHE